MDLFSYLLGKKAGGSKGTTVIANPELTGTEADLTGLQVGNTKYKVPDNLEHYSTDEQVVGTWINGKPLYKKSINIGNLAGSSSSTSYSHNIENVDFIFKTEAIAYASNFPAHNSFSIPYIVGSSSYVGMYVDNTSVTIVTSSNRSDYTCVVTLWYTKTTD